MRIRGLIIESFSDAAARRTCLWYQYSLKMGL